MIEMSYHHVGFMTLAIFFITSAILMGSASVPRAHFAHDASTSRHASAEWGTRAIAFPSLHDRGQLDARHQRRMDAIPQVHVKPWQDAARQRNASSPLAFQLFGFVLVLLSARRESAN